MLTEKIAYKNTHLFSSLLHDYLYDAQKLKDLYAHTSSLENIEQAVKHKIFSKTQRNLLVSTLEKQHPILSDITSSQIKSLQEENTFTICTAHQPLLMGGPLYFIHKIASCIKLCKITNEKFPNYRFVPIYWMGSEDHDIDEVNHFHVYNRKYEWKTEKGGPVGKKVLDEQLFEIKEQLKVQLGTSANAEEIYSIIDSCYQIGDSLSASTKKLVYALFEAEGIIVLDQNDASFKKQMIPAFIEEIENNSSSKLIADNLQFLESNYSIQASPREINMFYLTDKIRERIIEVDGIFQVNNTELNFTKEALIELIQSHPENFSPNVILRPYFQESILPNIAFVGGAGEIAYWLQLRPIFDAYNTSFPMLIMRDMALYIDEKTWNRFKQKGFQSEDIFKHVHDLEKAFIAQNHSIENLFDTEKTKIVAEYDVISSKIGELDKSLMTTVQAEKQKILNSIAMLEAKTFKSFKKKSDDDLIQIQKAKSKFFPNEVLQERFDNFMMYYLVFGKAYTGMLIDEMNAFDNAITLFVY